MASSSGSSASAATAGPSKKKSAVKRKANDWTWEDEMLMYDISQRDTKKKRRKLQKEEERSKDHGNDDEAANIKKQKEAEVMHMREERKLFLGGLSPDTVEKDLRKHFSKYGQMVDVQVMRDREAGVSRGFGFVTFACSFMAEAAMDEEAGHVINERKIEPKWATPDAPRYRRGTGPAAAEAEAALDQECVDKRSIFVGALKDSITEDDLVSYFSGFGCRVIRAVKIRDRATGSKKTFGFVDFADYGVVRKIMRVTKHYIQGKRIRVELSRPRIEFSHQTKTIFVGGLEDGIDDQELHKYLLLKHVMNLR